MRVSGKQTRRWLRVAARVLFPASLVLTGCGATTSPSQNNSSGYKIHAPLAQTSNIVFVMPVEGMRDPGRLVLADAIAASLRDAARPSVISGKANDQGPTVVGRISEVRKRGSIAWVTATWDLRAPYGTTVASVNHEIVVDSLLWDEGGVEAVNLIVAEAEPHIIGMVADHVGPLGVSEEIAMPPEERFAIRTGTSQVIEQQTPAAPMMQPNEGMVRQEETRLPELIRDEMPPLQVLEELTEAPVNTLTEEDLAAAPPPIAQAKPMRLMPNAEMESLENTPDAAAGTSLDEAALPNAATAEPAMVSDVPDNTQLKPISWGRPAFLIRAVSGAPGDGNEVLTSGIKKAMREQDLTVTEDPRQAGYEIAGRVVVGPPVNGRQQARVEWRVTTLDGVEVGKAMQENAVIAGSLDGEWGRVGDIVSQAAVQGIQELFENAPLLGAKATEAPDFSRNPSLKQVPGRAPPPPNFQ